MAENKKGFIFYADWKDVFAELKESEAGRLIKHIFSYVNDENPAEPIGVVKMAWIPIKAQLKRDLKKWESTREKRSEAGKISAQKRQQNSTNSTNSTNAESVEQNSTNSTVNVTATVTDTATVNATETETVKVTEKKKINDPPPIDEFLGYCFEILKEKYLPLEFSLRAKYEAWISDGWQTGHGKKIKNWKSTIKNTIPYLKPMHQNGTNQFTGNGTEAKPTGFISGDLLNQMHKIADENSKRNNT